MSYDFEISYEVHKMKENILLFIPGYNCEKQIARVLEQLDASVLKYFKEIIMVNNRSTDNTEKTVQEWMQAHTDIPMKLLRNDENYGLGGSHKVAFQYAMDNEFDYIVVLHGDDQGNIHDILPILKSENYKEFDCCLGAYRDIQNSVRLEIKYMICYFL